MCLVLPLVEHRSLPRNWIPPIQNHFRVDVDAGFDVKRNAFSIEAIICDYLGKLVGLRLV